MREAFATLEIEPCKDIDAIARAYHKLVKQYHPDKVATLAPRLREIAEQETKKINSAFATVRAFLR